MKPEFQLDIEGTQVSVYYWDDKAALNKAAKKFAKMDGESAACYIVHKNTHQLHFVREWVGVGYVTHELVHLGIHLIGMLNPGEIEGQREEQFCDLVEEAARQFWDKHYDLQELNA